MIITPTAGLVRHDTIIRLSQLRGFSRGRIDVKNRAYVSLLQRTAKELAVRMGPGCELILLGSLATGKYLDILAPIYGDRLRVPEKFIGLGDMSRGGLLLRCVKENRQLDYIDAARCASRAKPRDNDTRRGTGPDAAAEPF